MRFAKKTLLPNGYPCYIQIHTVHLAVLIMTDDVSAYARPFVDVGRHADGSFEPGVVDALAKVKIYFRIVGDIAEIIVGVGEEIVFLRFSLGFIQSLMTQHLCLKV